MWCFKQKRLCLLSLERCIGSGGMKPQSYALSSRYGSTSPSYRMTQAKYFSLDTHLMPFLYLDITQVEVGKANWIQEQQI